MNISLAAEPIFHIGGFPVTNSLVVSVVLVVGFLLLALVFKRRALEEVPKGFQNLVETIIEGSLQFVESVTGSRVNAERFFPLVATIFFFVLFSNWFGLLPGVGSIGLREVEDGHQVLIPIFRSASADLNTTLAIALASVLGTQFFGIVALGFFKHASKYLNFKALFRHFNFQNLIMIGVGMLELISEVSRVVSFSFRLFGNVFAGEVLLIVVSALVPYLAPLPFIFLEIFVGMVQALVFSLLTIVFLTIATTEHAEH